MVRGVDAVHCRLLLAVQIALLLQNGRGGRRGGHVSGLNESTRFLVRQRGARVRLVVIVLGYGRDVWLLRLSLAIWLVLQLHVLLLEGLLERLLLLRQYRRHHWLLDVLQQRAGTGAAAASPDSGSQ